MTIYIDDGESVKIYLNVKVKSVKEVMALLGSYDKSAWSTTTGYGVKVFDKEAEHRIEADTNEKTKQDELSNADNAVLSKEDRAMLDGMRNTAYICGYRGGDVEYAVHQALKRMGRYDLLPPCERK